MPCADVNEDMQFLAGFWVPTTGFAATLPVPCSYATIQDAINAAATGDVVVVAPDTYYENIDLRSWGKMGFVFLIRL
jgi:hypothetical protein